MLHTLPKCSCLLISTPPPPITEMRLMTLSSDSSVTTADRRDTVFSFKVVILFSQKHSREQVLAALLEVDKNCREHSGKSA